jgi:nuclear pore complex protein Nup62
MYACMYVCMYVCMYACMYVCICGSSQSTPWYSVLGVEELICAWCMYVGMHASYTVCICVYIGVCMYVCMYVCIMHASCMHMRVHWCMHTCIRTRCTGTICMYVHIRTRTRVILLNTFQCVTCYRRTDLLASCYPKWYGTVQSKIGQNNWQNRPKRLAK